MAEPIPTTVKRWKCPFCNRHESRKRKAVEHVERCWLDPAKKTCRTCAHHIEASTGDPCYAGGLCLCNTVEEGCEVSEPERFPVVSCPLWELAVTS